MLFFILGFVSLLLVILIGAGFLYFFIKRRREISFKQTSKIIIIYALGAGFINLIYPSSISFGLGSGVNSIINMLLFGSILYFAFYFVIAKSISFNWKEALTTFLIMSIIIFPFISYGRILLVSKMMELPALEKEIENIDLAVLISPMYGSPLRGFSEYPGITILNYVDTALLWFPNYARQIMLMLYPMLT